MAQREVVRIRRTALDLVLAQARRHAPLECCGLLLGTAHQVEEAYPARNALASRTRYRVEPADHFAALRRARDVGLAVVGAYHSHPAGAPIPSPRDVREANDPDLLHLIVGLPEGALRAYRLAEGNFHPVELVPVT